MSALAEIILIARIGVSVKRSDLLRILVNVAGKMEEIVFEDFDECVIVVFVYKNISFFNTAVVDVIVAAGEIGSQGVLVGH